MQITVFWDMTPYRWVRINQSFGETYCCPLLDLEFHRTADVLKLNTRNSAKQVLSFTQQIAVDLRSFLRQQTGGKEQILSNTSLCHCTGRHLFDVTFITSLKSNYARRLPQKNNSHAKNTTALKDGRLSSSQRTAKANCKLHSISRLNGKLNAV